MLKFLYATQAEIPEKHRDLYTERDGKWYLQVEGAVDASRLTEFRDANTTLKGNFETIVAKITNKDVSEVKGIKFETAVEQVEAAITTARADAIKAGKGDIDKIVSERTEAMRAEHTKLLTAEKETVNRLNGELSNLKINQEVLKFATENGLRASAHPDILARAGSVFKLEEGKVVAYNAEGKPMYNANSEPLTISEWVVKQRESAGHLFEESKGGGSQTQSKGGASGGYTGVNPWAKETLNVTEQGKLYMKDKDLAIKLAAQHGYTLQ